VPDTTTTSSTPVLERRLGPFDAAAIIIANVIGGGILFRSPAVAAALPDATWFLLAWVGGGVLAFMGAMAYAELAALRPKAGGEYVYLREAFGPLAGFLTGWTSFVAGFSGAMAASAVFLIVTLDRFIPGVANSTALLAIPIPRVATVTFSVHTLAASAVIIVAALIHIRGVGPGRIASNVLTTLKIVSLVVFIGFGLTAGTGSPSNLTQSVGPVTMTGLLFAFIPVMFTYSGWNAASYMAEEIRDPGRNVPRALLMGTVAVIAVYLLMNVLYLFVIPIGELATLGGKSVLDVVGDRLLGPRAGDIMAIVAILSLAAGINAWTFAGPRVYFAMARDNAFFKSAAQVHPKYKTPAASIIAQAVLAIVLILTGSLDSIANYVGFAITLFAGTAVAAVFVLRAREPNAPRPFKALGYPWTPAIFVLVSLAIVVNAFFSDPRVSLTGSVIILAGIPLYYFFTRKNR
jgi:basic amino acid/polyamine antiporter, APA family